MGGQRGSCQQLSKRKDACILLNKQEALNELIQVNDDEEWNGGQALESMVASYMYLGVSNPGLQMLGSNEYQYGTGAHSSISEEILHSIFSGLRSPKATGIL